MPAKQKAKPLYLELSPKGRARLERAARVEGRTMRDVIENLLARWEASEPQPVVPGEPLPLSKKTSEKIPDRP